MPDGRICCALGVCCEPPHQAVSIADHLGISMEAATAIAGREKGQGHILIPRTLPAIGAAKETAIALTAQKELAQIHRMLRARLPRILEDLGYGKMEIRPPEEPA